MVWIMHTTTAYIIAQRNISNSCGRQTHWYWRRLSFRPVDFPRRNIICFGDFQKAVAAATAVIYEILSIRWYFIMQKKKKKKTHQNRNKLKK